MEIGQGKFYGYDLFSQIADASSASSHSSIKSASVLDLSTLSTGPFPCFSTVRVSNCLNPEVSVFLVLVCVLFRLWARRCGDDEEVEQMEVKSARSLPSVLIVNDVSVKSVW